MKKRLFCIGNLKGENAKYEASQVYSPKGISQTICACTHGYAFGYVLTCKAEKKKLRFHPIFKMKISK